MTDGRKNIKVPPNTHQELKDGMHPDDTWPAYLLRLKRMAEREPSVDVPVTDVKEAARTGVHEALEEIEAYR